MNLQQNLATYTLLLLLAFCLASFNAQAQAEYTIKNFNIENGLLQNEITAMSMDKDGYLWLGTRSGLVRYDGAGFRDFITAKKNNNPLSSHILYTMYLPAEKELMVKTRSGDLYAVKNARPAIFLDSVASGGDNFITLTGHFPSLNSYKQLQSSVNKYIDKKTVDYGFAYLAPVNTLDFFAGSANSNKLNFFRNGKPQKTIELADNPKNFISSGGYQFIVEKQNGILVFDTVSLSFKKVQADWNSIISKDSDIKESLFYSDSYSGDAFCLYNSTFYMLRFDAAQSLVKFIPQFTIKEKTHYWTGIVYDSIHSTFFLSTPNEGFFQVRLKKMQTFNLTQKIKGELNVGNVITYTALKTSDSTVLIHNGTQFTSTASGIKTKQLGNFFGDVLTLALLKDNAVLCSQNGMIYYYSPKDNYMVRHIFNDSFNRRFNYTTIELLYPEGDSVWVTSKDVFCNLTSEKMNVLFESDKQKTVTGYWYMNLRTFYRVNSNEVLVTNENGLYRLHTDAPYRLDSFPEMKGKFVRYIDAYKDVLILSVYGSGLYILKGNRFYKVPIPESMPELTYCHSTYIDKRGNIWVPTDKGMFRSSAATVAEGALKGTTPFFFYYGQADGIANTEFNGSGKPTYAVLKNEQLFYPSMGGIVTFRAGEFSDKIMNTPVFIDKVTANDKEIDEPASTIRLHARVNYLSVDITTPNFGDTRNLWIEYRLDSSAWKKLLPGDHQRITLTDISSGKHFLSIRKRTGFGSHDFVYTHLEIYKEKSIFESFWFYLCLLLMIAVITWLLLRLKTQNLNRKRKHLQKMVDEQTTELSRSAEVKDLLINVITHDMLTPLKHISMIASFLKKGLEKDPEKAGEALSDIQSTADRIMSDSSSIINWMQYNNNQVQFEKKPVHLAQLVDDIFELYMPIANNKGVEFINELPPQETAIIDQNIIENILSNIFDNAVKHTASGKIRVYIKKGFATGSKTVLKISDTGTGMKKETLWLVQETLKGNLQALKTTTKMNTGLGYVLIAELLKIHGLSLTVESELQKGTTVSLFL